MTAMSAIETLLHDARFAARALRHSRGYTFSVIGTLAIGMAVTTAALALLNASMLLPFTGVTEQERLVRVAVSRNCGRPNCWAPMSSADDYIALKDGLVGLESLAGYAAGNVSVGIPDARSMHALLASANYFDVLAVRPALGRGFTKSDEQSYAAVAVVGYATWTREFGSDPEMVGRSIRVGDDLVQIVGVAPPYFIGIDRIRSGGESPDLWLPMWLADRLVPVRTREQPEADRAVSFVGRLRKGVRITEVETQAAVVAKRLAALRTQAAERTRAEVRRVWRVRPESWQFGVVIVLPIPILVLVIACGNAANLMLARGTERHREIAIRLAIGAGRSRIVRQLLIESAMLAAVSTVFAVGLAWSALQFATNPLGTPIPFDRLVLAFTVVTAVVTTIVFGLVPALRVSAQRPSGTLGAFGARSDAVPAQARLRRALIVVQATISLGLLATAWQLVSTVQADAVSSGTPPNQLLIARFDLRPFQAGPSATDSFYADLVSGISRLPDVDAVGIARATSIWSFGGNAPASVRVWRPSDSPEMGREISGGYVGGDIFRAVGLRVIAGRDFVEADRGHSRPQVAIVNRAFADQMDGAVVGTIVHIAAPGEHFVSGLDVRLAGIVESTIEPRIGPGPPSEKIYLPAPIEAEPALAAYIRTRGPAVALAQPVRELASRINPRVPVLQIGSLQEFNERGFAQQLWLARAAVFVGAVGLLLATAGLYGISSYVVAMRSRELAIRIALGARPAAILSMVLTQSMRVAIVGLFCGGISALVASRIIQSEYHGIVGIDRPAFAGAVLLFLTAMLAASALPAIRASRVDPVENLRDA